MCLEHQLKSLALMVNSMVALASQPTPVLVALWRHLKSPVDPTTGKITPGALKIVQLLHGRGYPLRSLV